MDRKIIFVLLITLSVFLFFGCTQEDVNTDNNQTNNNTNPNIGTSILEKCLTETNSIESIDNCYIAEADRTNLTNFCNDVTSERKQDCFNVIEPEEPTIDENFDYAKPVNVPTNESGPLTGFFGLSLASSTDFPQITHTVIPFADVDEPLTVSAQITNLGPNGKAYVVYKNSYNYGAEGWASVAMTNTGGNNYSGTIPLNQITPTTNMPNMVTNGGLENWTTTNGVTGLNEWAIGWATIKDNGKETNPANVIEGNASWKLKFAPMFFNHLKGPDRGICTTTNSKEFKGSIQSSPFDITGDYISFYAVSGNTYENPSTVRDTLSTPWGEIGATMSYKFQDTDFKSRVQLIDNSTGAVLEDSAIFSFDYLLEYEWSVSTYIGKKVYIKIIDPTTSTAGAAIDSFLQIKNTNGAYEKVDFTNNGIKLDNINFEKGDFSGWTASPTFLWRLIKIDGDRIPIDEKDYNLNYGPNVESSFLDTRTQGQFLQDYKGVRPLEEKGGYNTQTRLTDTVCPSARCNYLVQNHLETICGGVSSESICLTSGKSGSTMPYRYLFTNNNYATFNNYLKLAEGLGNFVLTSEYSPYLERSEDFLVLIDPELDCPGTSCNTDGSCNCEEMDCEINLHNSWTKNVVAQQPYELSYKIKNDKGFSQSQLVLWCDYEGSRFTHVGMVDGQVYGMDIESRGKYFTNSICTAGTEWTECKSVIMIPPEVTTCGDFRLVTGKAASTGNTIWIDDLTFKPIRTGIKYYIKVVNDNGEFSDVFPDYEKNWETRNNSFTLSSLEKGAKFFAGSTDWTNYTVEYKVKEQEAIGYQGYAWSEGTLLFRAIDNDNYYELNFNPAHDLIDLTKVVNGRGEQILLQNPLPSTYKGKAREKPQRDYRPFYDERNPDTILESGRTYTIKLVVNGTSIKVYLDNLLILDEVDSTFSKGKIGLKAYNSIMQFSDIKVTNSSGSTLFQDNFSNFNQWKTDATLFGATHFVATGQKKNWKTILTVNDFDPETKPSPYGRGGVGNWYEWPLQKTSARYVTLKITDGGLFCNNYYVDSSGKTVNTYRGDQYPGYFSGIDLAEIEIIDSTGQNVLLNKPIIESNVVLGNNNSEYIQSINDGKNTGTTITGNRNKSMLTYEPYAYIVFDLGSNKSIEKLRLHSRGATTSTSWPQCGSDKKMDPRDFTIEAISQEDY